MSSRAVQTESAPVQVRLADESLFACSVCGVNEFKMTSDEPVHLFCRCGQVYTMADLPPLEGA